MHSCVATVELWLWVLKLVDTLHCTASVAQRYHEPNSFIIMLNMTQPPAFLLLHSTAVLP